MAFASAFSSWAGPFEDLFDHVVEHGGVELVDDLLPLSLGDDQARVAELPEVSRDGGPGRGEVFGDVARCLWAVPEEAEDVAASGVGEGFEGVAHLDENIYAFG